MYFEVRRAIRATPDRAWSCLTDARRLVAGDLGITRLEGQIAAGAKLKLWSEAAPGRSFPLKVTVFEAPHRMRWEGGMPFGLFKGVRQFNLEPHDGGVVFHMREDYSGPLLGLIGKSLPDLTPSFEKFAAGLAALAESTER
jgi:hypothetical protein